MQGLDTYYRCLGPLLNDGVLKLEARLVRNEENAQNHLWRSETNKWQRTGSSVKENTSLEGIYFFFLPSETSDISQKRLPVGNLILWEGG